MDKIENSKPFLLFLFVVSIIGSVLVPLLLTTPNLRPDVSSLRGIAISAIYSTICVLGIFAVFYPGKCKLSFKKASNTNNGTSFAPKVELKGHHPNCENFSANRLTIRNVTFCSACTGLLIGAIVSLMLTALFTLGFF